MSRGDIVNPDGRPPGENTEPVLPPSGPIATTSVPTADEITASSAPMPSPAWLAWRRLRRNRTAMLGGILLIVLYLSAAFGTFLAPRNYQDRDYAHVNHPPTLPRFFDEKGHFHARPFVFGMNDVDPMRNTWKYDLGKKYPIRFFVHSYPYKLWWLIPTDLHLLGTDKGGFLAPLGTDSSGNDVFSAVLEGAKISLSIGLVGIAISVTLGMFMGAIAGYFGGFVDGLIMRVVEFLMSIPWLYLVIALRAFFQTKGIFGIGGETPSSTEMYMIIIAILALIGWASQARVIRGMVLSLKEQEYVLAERAMGASTFRILSRHILPNTLSYVIISVTISIPGYILGEIVLSYLSVGIQPPQVSWGLLLEAAQSPDTMRNYPWLLLSPAIAIFLTVMAFNFLGDGLRDALDPKHTK